MRIALFAPGYPTDEVPYNFAFVHARARLYANAGHEVRAFALGIERSYVHDEIRAATGTGDTIVRAIRAFAPDVLALHGPSFRMIAVAERLDIPGVTWVHGHEALFSLRAVAAARGVMDKTARALKAVPRNVHQLRTIRKFLPTQRAVVFVSRWMQEEAQRHTMRRYDNAVVIPNPIDTNLFSYRLDPGNRVQGVTTRGLDSTKYGLDVAIRAFAGLDAASLTVVGTGALEKKLRRLIHRTRSRARLDARFVPHRKMPELFSRFGFFVAPSRVEAQGVAMCEAMACGLPVVATRVGGIPEFVTHMKEGLLVPPEDPETLRAAVVDLLRDEARYLEMSRAARERMEKQCASSLLTAREIAVLEEARV